MIHRYLLLLTSCLLAPWASAETPAVGTWQHEELRRFPAQEARQGVAVDDTFFYAIDNYKIGKYRKDTGERVGGWEGKKDGAIKHLNAGTVIEGKLHAAHSNFPTLPALSSMEIWDVASMKHLGRHDFGAGPGSLTWIQPRGTDWYACFAHYAKDGGPGPAGTKVIRYDRGWREISSWSFPEALVKKFGKSSASCGAFGPGGHLFVTGHDTKELYVLDIPSSDSTLVWKDTIPISAEGQAFAWDTQDPELLYSISRKNREVIISRVSGRPAR